MAIFQISEFNGIGSLGGQRVGAPDGPPKNVTNLDDDETYTVPPSGVSFIRLKPLSGAEVDVTHGNGEVERFDAAEVRFVRAGDTFHAAAV